jgi:RND superfamily putative drug exporter
MTFTERWARVAATRPKRTLLIWIVALLAGGAIGTTLLGGALTTEGNLTGSPESKQASDLIKQRLGREEPLRDVVIVQSATETAADSRFRSFVEKLHGDLAALGRGTVSVAPTYYQSHDRSLVSQDGHTMLLPIRVAGKMAHAHEHVGPVVDVVERANGQQGFRVVATGDATIGRDFMEVSDSDLQRGEGIGIPAALVILVVVFGALVAAFVPLIMAVFAIILAIALVAVVGQAMPLSFYAINMLTFMGLAVGIDYSLFIVSRYREERARGRDKIDAIAASGSTASRAVLFSGMTVVLALVGMLIVPTQVFISLAVGAILVVFVAVVAALTLLPALLSLLGDRINAVRIPFTRRIGRKDENHGMWVRIVRFVMRRPASSLAVGVSLMLLAALPTLDLHTGSAGVSTLPDNLKSKQGFMILDRQFSAGDVSPAEIVIDGQVATQPVQVAITKLTAELRTDHRFGRPTLETHRKQNLAIVTVPIAGDPSGKTALATVHSLRDRYVPEAFRAADAHVVVGGAAAINVDYFAVTDHYLPIVFALVLGLSFILLLVAFRSVVVPLTSIVMNLLSVGAAYGLLVLVTQKGYLTGVLGFQRVDTVEAWVPLFLFSVLFGLSMDYQVFLLSRIRERYDATGEARESVAYGIGSTAHLITGAALIMVVVFAGFASGELVMFQQMGFGLAVAILLDATIVRTILMPATMELLGEWNWYLPRFLEWLPSLSVEGPSTGEAVEPAST